MGTIPTFHLAPTERSSINQALSAAINGGVQLLPELVTSVRSSLRVVGIHGTKVQMHRLRKNGDILRIMPGIYLPVGILTNASSTERQEITFIARLAALSIRYPTYVLSGPSAAFLLGLPTACRLKDLFVYTSSPSGTRRIVFPHVVTPDGAKTPGTTISTCRPSHPIPAIEYLGFRIATPARVVVDCARLLDDRHGFPIACAGLARACQFDRFHQDESRARQEEVRGEFSEALADTPRNTIGRERARWVINSADAGCESPGESLVLLALLRAGINGMTTQEEVHINDHTYFIDIALPDLKIAIEFDGRIKYGETVDQVHDCIEAEQRRQRDLERAGWTVIRVRWSDLRVIDEVVAQALVAIRAKKGN